MHMELTDNRKSTYLSYILSFFVSSPPVSAQAVNITTPGSPVAGQNYSLTCTGAFVGNASIVSMTTWRNATGGIPGGSGITGGSRNFNIHTSHGEQYICLSTLSYHFNSTATNMMKSLFKVCSNGIFTVSLVPRPYFYIKVSGDKK